MGEGARLRQRPIGSAAWQLAAFCVTGFERERLNWLRWPGA